MSGRGLRGKTIAEAIGTIIVIMTVWAGVGWILPIYLLAYGVISGSEFLGWLVAASIAIFVIVWYWLNRWGPAFTKSELFGITGKQLTFLVELIVGVFAVGATLITVSTYVSPPYTLSSCDKPTNVSVTSPNCQVVKTVSVTNPGPSGIGVIGFWIIELGLTGLWTFVLVYFIVLVLQRFARH